MNQGVQILDMQRSVLKRNSPLHNRSPHGHSVECDSVVRCRGRRVESFEAHSLRMLLRSKIEEKKGFSNFFPEKNLLLPPLFLSHKKIVAEVGKKSDCFSRTWTGRQVFSKASIRAKRRLPSWIRAILGWVGLHVATSIGLRGQNSPDSGRVSKGATCFIDSNSARMRRSRGIWKKIRTFLAEHHAKRKEKKSKKCNRSAKKSYTDKTADRRITQVSKEGRAALRETHFFVKKLPQSRREKKCEWFFLKHKERKGFFEKVVKNQSIFWFFYSETKKRSWKKPRIHKIEKNSVIFFLIKSEWEKNFWKTPSSHAFFLKKPHTGTHAYTQAHTRTHTHTGAHTHLFFDKKSLEEKKMFARRKKHFSSFFHS